MDLNGVFNDVLNDFGVHTKQRHIYLRIQEKKCGEFKKLTKCLYDTVKSLNSNANSKFYVSQSLSELHLNKFDEEQIWQQIELNNYPALNKLTQQIARISLTRKDFGFGIIQPTNINEPDAQERYVDSDDSDSLEENLESDDESFQDENERKQKTFERRLVKKSSVDDQFFCLADMEEFLKDEDLREEKTIRNEAEENDEDEDEIDYFNEFPSDDESINEEIFSEIEDDNEKDKVTKMDLNEEKVKNARELMFSDFFDPPYNEMPDKKQIDFSEDESDSVEKDEMGLDTRDVSSGEEEETVNNEKINPSDNLEASDSEQTNKLNDNLRKLADNQLEDDQDITLPKSEFERQQRNLKKKMEKLETQLIADKPWQLQGEIVGYKRPENSLLEEHLLFDHVTRPAPIITEETTKTLEELISQRIKDAAWDDVERKIKPTQQPFEYRRRLELDQEKSKTSLAEVYEKEYLKKQQLQAVPENPEEKEIKTLMRSLFAQLDALSNFHFTPRPPEPEVKVINNLPAIMAEEAIPVAVNDATLLAPEEVFEKPKGEVKNLEERTRTDKKRERRKKKKFQHDRNKHDEKKVKLSKIGKPQSATSLYAKLNVSDKLSKKKKGSEDDKLANKAVKSSKDFFSRLQDQVTKTVQSAKSEKTKKLNKTLDSSKLKL